MSIPANDWIAHHARFSPGQEAVHDLASDRHFTYTEFHDRVDRAALYLRDSLGVGDGDRLAVLSHNDSDVFELQFACRRIGAIFLPLNWRLAVPELEYICNDATPAALLYGTEFVEETAEVQRLSGVPRIATLNNGGDSDYEAGLAAASGSVEVPPRELTDIWTVMYTSGTTGRPKGAKITYQMAIFNAVQCAMTVEITNRSKNLVFLPTFHTGGLNVYANPIFHTGGTNVVLRTFEP
ncbi:MAG: AMP-binding protein, partial [Alphaproteobacteria bacterium]|nr:AMP-binding protein [Alphaproteobacteria bacterium]